MKKTERQMALVIMLHGIMQGMAKPPDACLHSVAANQSRVLSFKP